MTWRASLWLAFRGGRSDRLRIVLTAGATALATVFILLAGAVVTPSGDAPVRYTGDSLWTETGLTAGVVLALVLLCLPALALAAQCSRIGAPARQRRFTNLAWLGATDDELGRLAALEAAVASAVGVLVGLFGYGVLVVVVATAGAPVVTTKEDGTAEGWAWAPDALLLPTDRVPTWWVVLLGILLVPVVVTVVARAGRKDRAAGAPAMLTGPRRAVVLVSSSVSIAVGLAFAQTHVDRRLDLVLYALMTLAAVALIAGLTGLVRETSLLLGGQLARRARTPVGLLAGRRMAGAAQQRGNAMGTFLLGCAIGGAVVVLRSEALAVRADDPFFVAGYALVLVGVGVATVVSGLGLVVGEVESVVERRRSLATAVAAGVPRKVLARAGVLEAALPVVPAVVISTLAGAIVALAFVTSGEDEQIGTVWPGLVGFIVAALGAVLLAAGLAALALPSSTDISEARVPA